MSKFELREKRFSEILGYMAEQMRDDNITYCLVMMIRGISELQVAYTEEKHSDLLDWINRGEGTAYSGADVSYAGNLSFEDKAANKLLMVDGGTSLPEYQKDELSRQIVKLQLGVVLASLGNGIELR